MDRPLASTAHATLIRRTMIHELVCDLVGGQIIETSYSEL